MESSSDNSSNNCKEDYEKAVAEIHRLQGIIGQLKKCILDMTK